MTLSEVRTHRTVLDSVLKAALARIQVSDDELAEARTRRDAIAAALRTEFSLPGAPARIYVNGSIAHGDALTPLTDVDLGVVVPDPDGIYGPGKTGPTALEERAAAAIRVALKPDYGDLQVEVKGRKRSILIRFRDPVTPGQPDFTADVITAIDNTQDRGLYIPRFTGWDRSHPEEHTKLVRRAVADTDVAYARVVRLLKHWNRMNGKPLCSWNIKALALDCLTAPVGLTEGLRIWFAYAISEFKKGETEDPAGVAPHPIKLNVSRSEAIRKLEQAQKALEEAIQLAEDGYAVLAEDTLANLFHDEAMLPHPAAEAVRAQAAARFKAQVANTALDKSSVVTGTSSSRERVNARSWAV